MGTVFWGNILISYFKIENYWIWACVGFLCTILATAITVALNTVFYRKDIMAVLKMLVRRKRKR